MDETRRSGGTPPDPHDAFESPLATRYAGRDMVALFTPRARALAWRDVWLALAEAEAELGAPITDAQLQALRDTRERLDLARVAELEARTRHDVMAHVRAWGEVCPAAAGVLHLGATSCDVTDNADALVWRRALRRVRERLVRLARVLARRAGEEADRPALGYTHFQPAQPVTVGKRFALWLQDVVADLREVEAHEAALPLRGLKGTTGTQASFLELLGGEARALELERRFAGKLGFERTCDLTGQTAPRKLVARLGDVLAGVAVSLGKLGHDVRLLSHTGEVREGFGEGQVGSSAMPYKRNPMRAERVCALARLALSLRDVLAHTAATQWLERSLDDSAALRVTVPELFLAVDGALRTATELAVGLDVDALAVSRRLADEGPLLCVERLLVRGVQRGGDRQALHEALRAHALAARGAPEPGHAFVAALEAEPLLAPLRGELRALLDPAGLVGLAGAQVRAYLRDVVTPLLAARADVPEVADPLSV